MKFRALALVLFAVMVIAPNVGAAITVVQERGIGFGSRDLSTGSQTFTIGFNATSPSTVNGSLSTTRIHADITAHLRPTAVSAATINWEVEWKGLQLCRDDTTSPSGGPRLEVSWSIDCPFPSYLVGDHIVYINFTTMTNTEGFVSAHAIQTEVVQMDSITIENAGFMFADISNLTVVAFLLALAAVVFFTRRWVATGFGLTTAALVAYVAGLGLTPASDNFLLFLGIAIMVMVIEALHFALTSRNDDTE